MRKAISAAAGVALASVSMVSPARAEGGAVSLGLRTGYAIPMGDIAGGGGAQLSDNISGVIPIWIDAGYKLNPNMYIGADFQYGIALINNDKTGCGMSGRNCSANDVMFGVNFHYHLMPDQTIDPWAGVGIGYEIMQFGSTASSSDVNGFQFLNLQLGGDYKATPELGIGPFLMFSLGQFSNCGVSVMGASASSCTINQTAMHEWLTIGIRGVYDIAM
jgi:outer membrane protein W